MGNSESKSDQPRSPQATSAPTPPGQQRRDVSQRAAAAEPAPRRTPSAKAPSHATPPTTLLPSTTPSTSTSTTHAQATVSASPGSSQTRARAVTAGISRLAPEDSPSAQRADSGVMGQGNSKDGRERPPSRSATLPSPDTGYKHPTPPTQPTDIPQPSPHDGRDDDEAIEAPMASSSYGLPPSNYTRPPRLPLPIERDPEPSSPLLSPQDTDSPALESRELHDRARSPSVQSSTTLDEEYGADIEAFAMDSHSSGPKVPTTLEWRGPAKTVHVTGTFCNWERKFRLHRSADKGSFSVTMPLPTGTHHIKFLVDDTMKTSDDLPTTVDFTNSLVNYIEVVAVASPTAETQPPAPAQPMPIPGAAAAAGQSAGTAAGAVRTPETRVPETSGAVPSTLQETVPTTDDSQLTHRPRRETASTPSQPTSRQLTPSTRPAKPTVPSKPPVPRPQYTREIPLLFKHLDLYNTPDDPRFQRASRAAHHLPAPPSLPGFMQRSILNVQTPHKDDASVLTMPNHTVLNHLATSSIKSGVLATSGTTRYKRKFLTTIMYKPVTEDG